jgi:hypothetical protein
VRRVVGREAVDRAVAQALEEAVAVGGGLDRGVDLEQRADARRVLVREPQVVRAGAGRDRLSRRARLRDELGGAGRRDVEHVQARPLLPREAQRLRGGLDLGRRRPREVEGRGARAAPARQARLDHRPVLGVHDQPAPGARDGREHRREPLLAAHLELAGRLAEESL